MMTTFPLLNLPKEIRLQIYASIPPTRQNWTFPNAVQHDLFATPFPSANGTVVFVVQQVSNAVLATCRQIYDEARGIITKRRREEVSIDGVSRIIIDMSILHVLPQKGGLFAKATEVREALVKKVMDEGDASIECRLGYHNSSKRTIYHNDSNTSHKPTATMTNQSDLTTIPTPTDRLSLITHLIALSLLHNPTLSISIRPFSHSTPAPTQSHLTTQLTRLCGLSGNHFSNLDILVGLASPQSFPSRQEWEKWERILEAAMAQMDAYMEQVVEFVETTSVRIGRRVAGGECGDLDECLLDR